MLNYDPKQISAIVRQDYTQVNNKADQSTAEGTVKGIVTGGVIGGLAALLTGIGAVTITGFAPLIIAGPLALALGISGTAAAAIEGAGAGAVAGGLVGALSNTGIPNETATAYQTGIEEGKVLLGIQVKNEGDEDLIAKIFNDEKAENVYTLNS